MDRKKIFTLIILTAIIEWPLTVYGACNKPEVIEHLESYILEQESSESSWWNPMSLLEDAATISSHEQMETVVEAAKYMDEKSFCSCYDELALDGSMKKPIEEYCKNLSDSDALVVMKVYDWSASKSKKTVKADN